MPLDFLERGGIDTRTVRFELEATIKLYPGHSIEPAGNALLHK